MATLARLDSKSVKIEQEIKANTQRFALDIVFQLSLSNKSLSSIPDLSGCINLVHLTLSHNSLTRIEGLDALTCLNHLDLSHNKICKLENLAHLSKLQDLRLQCNCLDDLRSLELDSQLRPLAALRVLCLQDIFLHSPASAANANRCCAQPGYKSRMLDALPNLQNLDGERNPSSSTYAERVDEYHAMVAKPPVKQEVVLPPVEPWLTEDVVQGAIATTVDEDPELADQTKRLVQSLDKCHMLLEVLTKEAKEARAVVAQQPTTG